MNIIGIDSGTSNVKIIQIDSLGEIIHKVILNKMPIIQALEIFINKEHIDKNNIKKIILTGIGTAEIEGNIYGITTEKVDEFNAIGMGGLYLTNKKSGLVVSIGTGTAFVEAKKRKFIHIGGTGIGGGTLLNLSKKVGNINTCKELNDAIIKGSLENIDLTIKDVTTKEIKTLPKDTTSSNFGKLNDKATDEDIILGVANMIFETLGMMAVFATRNRKKRNIIVIGNVATIPYIKVVLKKIEKLHKGVKFIIPNNAEFGTVIGAIEYKK